MSLSQLIEAAEKAGEQVAGALPDVAKVAALAPQHAAAVEAVVALVPRLEAVVTEFEKILHNGPATAAPAIAAPPAGAPATAAAATVAAPVIDPLDELTPKPQEGVTPPADATPTATPVADPPAPTEA